jgi:hypothetical protein
MLIATQGSGHPSAEAQKREVDAAIDVADAVLATYEFGPGVRASLRAGRRALGNAAAVLAAPHLGGDPPGRFLADALDAFSTAMEELTNILRAERLRQEREEA